MHAGGVDAVLNRVISSLLKDHATVHINFRPVRVWNTFYECKSLLHDLETLPKVYMVRYKYNITFSLGVCGKISTQYKPRLRLGLYWCLYLTPYSPTYIPPFTLSGEYYSIFTTYIHYLYSPLTLTMVTDQVCR